MTPILKTMSSNLFVTENYKNSPKITNDRIPYVQRPTHKTD